MRTVFAAGESAAEARPAIALPVPAAPGLAAMLALDVAAILGATEAPASSPWRTMREIPAATRIIPHEATTATTTWTRRRRRLGSISLRATADSDRSTFR
jgi:hypothetical protein